MSIIITILFLTLLNGFFSMSEMAIVASSRPMLRDMLKKGNKKVEDVLKILENQGQFLSSIQVGITAVGVFAAAYGGANIAHKFGDFLDKIPLFNSYGQTVALVTVVVCLTYVSVVIGELIPKKIALRNPEAISILVAKPMLYFSYIFSPIVKSLDFSAEVIMKFFGIFSKSEDKFTEAELKAIINEGAETGIIEKSEHEMMQRIFRLDNREVKSIMTHMSEVVAINLDDSIEEVKRKFQEAQHSRYPIVDRTTQKIVGIIQVKNILSDFIESNKFDIKAHLKEAHFISENTNCLAVLDMFKSSSIHLAVVTDQYGVAEGIVTASDLFESVVGLIPSNYDEEDEVMIQERENGSWLVDGKTPIDEISIVIGIEDLKLTEKYDTIAGFVLDNIDGSPRVGYKFSRFGFTFEVVDLDQNEVDKILITSEKKEAMEDIAD